MSGRGRILELTAILGPFAVVAGVRLLTGAGLTNAPAALVAALTPAAGHPPARPTLTAAQTRAAAWLEGVKGAEAVQSPMQIRVERPAPAPVDPAPARPAMRAFKLTAVMGSAGGVAMAMIDGKVYRVDDEVAPGCRLISIDVHACSAELRLADGTVVSVQRER